jgi:hypothetical protein
LEKKTGCRYSSSRAGSSIIKGLVRELFSRTEIEKRNAELERYTQELIQNADYDSKEQEQSLNKKLMKLSCRPKQSWKRREVT